MWRVTLIRWIAPFSLSLVLAGACESTNPLLPAPRSIHGNWQGELSDTTYLLFLRISPTGQASGDGVETVLGSAGSNFFVSGMYDAPNFLLHFSGPTYPADFVGTLRSDDNMVGEFRVSTPNGLRTRPGVMFSRYLIF